MNRPKYIILLFLFCIGGIFATSQASDQSSLPEPVCELHVFAHGSYGSLFSFLSYSHVKKDKIKGTAYLALQRMMRETQLVRYRRFSGRQGLFEVIPGAANIENDPARYVIGAYDGVRREVAPKDSHEHRYFLFGWSGLLSQRERRREAICLYNELAALTAQIRAQGKKPVVNLYAHSHGCNVGLNLGLVDACAFNPAKIPAHTEPEVVACMNRLLNGDAVADLPELVGQEGADEIGHLYRKPALRLERVDKLIMLAVPVQPETAPLVASQLFANVLQVYSENDGIIYRDRVSSKKISTALFDSHLLRGHPSIKVIRWMNNRTPLDSCGNCETQKKKTTKQSGLDNLKDLSATRMKRLKNGGGNPDSHHPEDPTHADFWSIGNKRDGAFFEQVPLLVFMPLMNLLLPEAEEAQYLDFCLIGGKGQAEALLFNVDDSMHPQLCAAGSVSLKPIQWARAGAMHILNVNKKLEIAVKVTLPFFKKK